MCRFLADTKCALNFKSSKQSSETQEDLDSFTKSQQVPRFLMYWRDFFRFLFLLGHIWLNRFTIKKNCHFSLGKNKTMFVKKFNGIKIFLMQGISLAPAPIWNQGIPLFLERGVYKHFSALRTMKFMQRRSHMKSTADKRFLRL